MNLDGNSDINIQGDNLERVSYTFRHWKIMHGYLDAEMTHRPNQDGKVEECISGVHHFIRDKCPYYKGSLWKTLRSFEEPWVLHGLKKRCFIRSKVIRMH